MGVRSKLPKPAPLEKLGLGPKKCFILVFGDSIPGFISRALGTTIPTVAAADVETVAQKVKDHVGHVLHQGEQYEVHLVDCGSFGNDTVANVKSLALIAGYVNIMYSVKQPLAGVLFMHDIAKKEIGTVDILNLQLLEKLIGVSNFSRCTIVTTGWDNVDLDTAMDREHVRSKDKRYFGTMLQNKKDKDNARIERFHPKTRKTARRILLPFLENEFTPDISKEMIQYKRPLGMTKAGNFLADSLDEDHQKTVQDILVQRSDEVLFQEFHHKGKKIVVRVTLQRCGRWVVRIAIVGGGIAATVLTAGPGAAIFALYPAFEKVAASQKKDEKQKKAKLQREFAKSSVKAYVLKDADPDWLWDLKVKKLRDLIDRDYVTFSTGPEATLLFAEDSNVAKLKAARKNKGEPDDFSSDLSDDE